MYYKIHDDAGEEIFYNPVQVQNRDLSILMISMFAERRAKRKAEVLLKRWKRQNKDSGLSPKTISVLRLGSSSS